MTEIHTPGNNELAKQFRTFIDPDYVISDSETMKTYEWRCTLHVL